MTDTEKFDFDLFVDLLEQAQKQLDLAKENLQIDSVEYSRMWYRMEDTKNEMGEIGDSFGGRKTGYYKPEREWSSRKVTNLQ